MRVLTSTSLAGSEFIAAQQQRRVIADPAVEETTRSIISEVRTRGDVALREYAQRFDSLAPDACFRVPQVELDRALDQIPNDLRDALDAAAKNIRTFCEWQKPQEWMRTLRPGVCVGQIVRPLASIGCYVPGGRHPLPSSLLMTVIPAQVAGVARIAVVSPNLARQTLAAAALLGITEFYRIGGAQAIAALAYGTASVPQAAKIIGPGNAYVTAAKKLVSDMGACAIDMLAGPTEALIVSDSGDPRFIAADLVAQAEHDPQTVCMFLTTSPALAKAVSQSAMALAAQNPTALASLEQNGACMIAASREEAFAIANSIASEHLTIDSAEDLAHITAAGSIFIGNYSSQVLGDYASGPNHVLPTAGTARYRGGLSVTDFVKVISVQEVSSEGLRLLSTTVTTLARAEGLSAHAAAVTLRLAEREANNVDR